MGNLWEEEEGACSRLPVFQEHPFIKRYETKEVDVAAWLTGVMDSPCSQDKQ